MTAIRIVEKKILKSFDDLDYDMSPTPQQIMEIYSNGFQGVIPNKAAYYSLRTTSPRFYDAFPQAVGLGKGKVSLPFKAILSLDTGFGSTEAQTVGDCVSHGTRNAGSIDYGIDAYFGETQFQGRFATENIYGARGHRGQGANCSVLAEYVSQDGVGGFLTRKKYTSKDGNNSVDLSVYKSSIGSNWGPMTPTWVNEIAAENKALRVFTIKTIEEYRDALAAGFGISLCSGYGFSSVRNADGVSEQSGGWSHCFTEDTWITSPVMKKINDIKIADKVICHDSNLHKVTNIFKRDYEGDLICIKASGLTTIKVTPEHPILINRPHIETIYINNDKTEEKIGGSALLVKPTKVRKTHFDTMWVKAEDIQLKDRLLLPNELFKTDEIRLPKWEDNPKCLRKPNKIDKPDKDLAWLFGLYIADGSSVKSHRICITLGLNEIEHALKVKEIIKNKIGLKTSILVKKNCLRVMIYSSILANSFKEWFGGGKLPKKIPEFMFYGWGKECLEQLIDGIYCGDGHDHKDRKEIVNSSKELIYQIQYILSCLGKNPAIRKPKQTGFAKTSKCKPIYLISWSENQNPKAINNKVKHQGYYLSTGVYKIDKEHFSGKVYNFEVEGKNSYIADGILVHNCMAHIGCDDSDWAYQKYGGILGLIANSWGSDWNSGPKRNDQPNGSFWVRPAVVQKLINAGGAFALASVRGYNRELVYDMASSVASLSKD